MSEKIMDKLFNEILNEIINSYEERGEIDEWCKNKNFRIIWWNRSL